MRELTAQFSTQQREWAQRHRHFVLAGGLTLFALALRMIALTHQSLWIDEGYSIWFANQSFAQLWGDIARAEFNPPLYYMLLRAWTFIFGDSVLALRGLSAVLSAACVPFVYMTALWCVRGHGRDLVAPLAALLFTLSFAQLQFAQETRTYALSVLAAAIIVAASARILIGMMDKRSGAAPHALWPYAMLGAGGALAMWSHYTSAVFLCVIGAFHLVAWLSLGQARRAFLYRYSLAGVVFAVLGGRAVWLMVAYAGPGSTDFWVAVPSVPDMLDATSTIFGASLGMDRWGLELLVRLLVFAPWPILGAFAMWRRGYSGERTHMALLISVSFVAFSVFLIVTLLGRPVFLQRIVVITQIGWVVLCGCAVLIAQTQRTRQFIALAMTACFALGTFSYLIIHPASVAKEPWRDIAEQIAMQASEGEVVYSSASGEILLGYYFRHLHRTDLQVRSVTGSMRTPPSRPPFQSASDNFTPPVPPNMAADLQAELQNTQPAWFVMRNPDSNSWSPVRDVLHNHGAHQSTRQVLNPGPLGVYRVPPRGQPISAHASTHEGETP